MIEQIIPSLKLLHSFGYSHGDLKLENICYRSTKKGQHKFTLIDFGVCQKFPKPGLSTEKKSFRGNFMFAAAD